MALQEFFNYKYYGTKNIHSEMTKIKLSVKNIYFSDTDNM